jgi:hypothetical protein
MGPLIGGGDEVGITGGEKDEIRLRMNLEMAGVGVGLGLRL